MRIKDKDYLLTPVKGSLRFYDLSLPHIINKGKDTEKQEFQIEAYGISLETALQIIMHYRAETGLQSDVNLQEYIDKLAEIRDSLKQIANG